MRNSFRGLRVRHVRATIAMASCLWRIDPGGRPRRVERVLRPTPEMRHRESCNPATRTARKRPSEVLRSATSDPPEPGQRLT
jgi:hypothetical protein